MTKLTFADGSGGVQEVNWRDVDAVETALEREIERQAEQRGGSADSNTGNQDGEAGKAIHSKSGHPVVSVLGDQAEATMAKRTDIEMKLAVEPFVGKAWNRCNSGPSRWFRFFLITLWLAVAGAALLWSPGGVLVKAPLAGGLIVVTGFVLAVVWMAGK